MSAFNLRLNAPKLFKSCTSCGSPFHSRTLMEGTSCSTIVYLHVSTEHLEHFAVGMLKCFQQLVELIRIGNRVINHSAFYKTVPVYIFPTLC